MGGIADQNDASGPPLCGFEPINRAAVRLRVLGECVQIVLNRGAEAGEARAQPLQATLHRIMSARLSDVCESIGAVSADWAQAEKASFTEPELDRITIGQRDRGEAAPHHLHPIGWRGLTEGDLAHARENAVGADHEIVAALAPVAECHLDGGAVLAQAADRGRKVMDLPGPTREQRLVQAPALDADERSNLAPERREIDLTEGIAALIAEQPTADDRACRQNRAANPQPGGDVNWSLGRKLGLGV